MLKYLNKIKRKIKQFSQNNFVSMKPNGDVKGSVLLSYIIAPFLLEKRRSISNDHTNQWECLQIAKTFLNLGYEVDVIDYTNYNFVPKKHYSFFIDIHSNMERIAPLLNTDCIKIFHLTGAHWLFQNHAEYKRLLDLQQRRGLTLFPRRLSKPTKALEIVDYATILGNQFTINTYKYANKEITQIPLSTTNMYPYPEDKNYEYCRNRFLWLGSSGLVHKGLDLVLEAFADMPEHHLTVCGPIQNEKDFEQAFHKELYQLPNIHTVGWIDVGSSEFLEITKNCIGLVYPSCSEGTAGSAVVCLHAGLIPIVSYESGINVNEFGFLLENSSVNNIQETVKIVTNLPDNELRQRAKMSWNFARNNYTREIFAEEYHKFVLSLIRI